MVLYNSVGEYLLGAELPLATKAGTQIPNERKKLDPPPVSLASRADSILRAHPTAKIRSLTTRYNCMGLVFGNRRTIIHPNYLEMILREDEYNRTTLEELKHGDVVVYRDSRGQVSHVGLVSCVESGNGETGRRVTVLSQWGQAGEYFHHMDDVHEELGRPTEYWTDRK